MSIFYIIYIINYVAFKSFYILQEVLTCFKYLKFYYLKLKTKGHIKMQQISLELAKFGQFAQSSIKNVDKQTFDELLKKLDKKTLIKIFGISLAGLSTFYLL
jgi:hypothetical protein